MLCPATDMWNLPWSTARCRRSSIKEFPVPYALLDEDGKVVWVNDEFSGITETSKRKLMKLNIVQVFEEVTEESLPYQEEVTEGEIAFNGREYRYEIRRVQVNKVEPAMEETDAQPGEAGTDGDGADEQKKETKASHGWFKITTARRTPSLRSTCLM